MSAWTGLWRRVLHWLWGGPVSLALLAVSWLAMAITGSLQALSEDTLPLVGAGPGQVGQGRWWTLLTSPFFAEHAIDLLWSTLFLVTVGIWTEKRLGSLWFLLMGLVAHAIGSQASSLMAWTAVGPLDGWVRNLLGHPEVGVTPFLAGALMTASARLDTLDRRRVRRTLGTVVVVLALFSGHLQDLTRLFAAAVGLLIGVVVWQRTAPQRPLTGTRVATREAIALMVAAVAVSTIATMFVPGSVGPLATAGNALRDVAEMREAVVSLCATGDLQGCPTASVQDLRTSGLGPLLVLLLPQLLLLVFADGLRRGRRAAWLGTMVLNGIIGALETIHLVDVLQLSEDMPAMRGEMGVLSSGIPGMGLLAPIIVPFTLCVVLALGWHHFRTQAPGRIHARVWGWVGGAMLVSLVVTVALGMLNANDFLPMATPLLLAADFVVRSLPTATLTVMAPTLLPLTATTTAVVAWLPALPWLVLIVAWLRMRTSTVTAAAERPRERVRALLHDPGGSSIAWCGTWGDNEHWVSDTRRAGVSWRPVASYALAVGDPVCAPGDVSEVVAEFAAMASQRGLVPALYSVGDATREAAAAHGWASVQVAEETVLDLPQLEFRGKKFQDVRTAINRAAKENVTTRWTTWQKCPAGLRDQILAISERWVSEKGLPEMGFTLGGLDELDDPEVRLQLAVDDQGTLHGAASWMPVFRSGSQVGLTLDFMRRRSDGFRPVMELLIATAAMDAKEEGLETLSLSAAPLAHVSVEADADDLERALDTISGMLEPVYGFRSLLAFKAKFQPRYVPLWVTFPDWADLPGLGVAIGRAYVPRMSWRERLRLGASLFRWPGRTRQGRLNKNVGGSDVKPEPPT